MSFFSPFTDKEVTCLRSPPVPIPKPCFSKNSSPSLRTRYRCTVGDNAQYGHVLDDMDDFLFTAIRKLGNETLQHKLQERI
ncbi:MAG: hypothetical protein LBU65_05070, partial [Planctomycetaceae bacterium]|nr:hypothetical protein [Planctomycetaceae bacterium]